MLFDNRVLRFGIEDSVIFTARRQDKKGSAHAEDPRTWWDGGAC
jgi:hypothetical protein